MQINDYTYTPTHTDSQLERAKKWLIDNTEKSKPFSMTANFAFVADETYDYITQACHAAIGYGRNKTPLIVTEAYLHPENRHSTKSYRRYNSDAAWKPYEGKTAELMQPFFDWVVYESVFGRFILNRDDKDSVERGFVVSTALPSGILQSIMILSRHFYEVCPESFEVFNRLRAVGIPGSVAYPVAFNVAFGCNTDYGVKPLTAVVVPKYNHRVMPLFKNMEDFTNFITGNATGLKQTSPLYTDLSSTDGTSSLFHTCNVGGQGSFASDLLLKDTAFKNMLKEHRGDSNKITAIVNPFARRLYGQPSPSPTDVTYGELFDVIIPYLFARGDFNDAIH